jgi:hypothetical protein
MAFCSHYFQLMEHALYLIAKPVAELIAKGTSALGYKRPIYDARAMSALAPEAFISPRVADERPYACACKIATHAPKKVRHTARESVASVIRASFLVCIAASFESIQNNLI